jgi:tetratricopeptide (TPR) repeat protein
MAVRSRGLVLMASLALLKALSGGMSAARAQDTEADPVERLFQEAQRYHLGVERPRDIRKAYRLYIDVIRRAPTHVDAHYNLAGLCFDQKRYDLAERYYRKVIDLRPTDADACNNLGVVYDRQGLEDRAVALYRKALKLDPELAVAHSNFAQTLLKRGDTEAALQAVEQALRLEPENPQFVNLQARILGEMGKLSDGMMLGVTGAFVALLVAYGLWHRRRQRI